MIRVFDELDSTSNYVAKLLEEGTYEAGAVILAHFQTEGRGMRGNAWQSARGENLTFSFAIPSPYLNVHNGFLLSKAVSVGLVQALRSYLGDEVVIKWPNDIWVHGAKLAGILIETKYVASQSWSMVGIGINVNQQHFPQGLQATSIRAELGAPVPIFDVLGKVLKALGDNLRHLESGHHLLLQADYMSYLGGTGRWIWVSGYFDAWEAMVVTVENTGAIVLRNRQGRSSAHLAKEVQIRL